MANKKEGSKGNKKRMYYKKGTSKKPLVSGVRGFLCVCNRHERECVRESMDLLSSFAERIYGPEIEEPKPNNETDRVKSCSVDEDDIEVDLEKEIAQMKSVPLNKKARFMKMDTGAGDIVFIKTRLQHPDELATAIFEEVVSTKKQLSRYLLRLIPVEATCKATKEEISKTAADVVFPRHFGNESKTYEILFRTRYSNSITKHEATACITRVFHEKFPKCRADFRTPQVHVIVEVIKSICCLSVLPHYKRFRKYNLIEVAQRGPASSSAVDIKVQKRESEVLDPAVKKEVDEHCVVVTKIMDEILDFVDKTEDSRVVVDS